MSSHGASSQVLGLLALAPAMGKRVPRSAPPPRRERPPAAVVGARRARAPPLLVAHSRWQIRPSRALWLPRHHLRTYVACCPQESVADADAVAFRLTDAGRLARSVYHSDFKPSTAAASDSDPLLRGVAAHGDVRSLPALLCTLQSLFSRTRSRRSMDRTWDGAAPVPAAAGEGRGAGLPSEESLRAEESLESLPQPAASGRGRTASNDEGGVAARCEPSSRERLWQARPGAGARGRAGA